ncbi:MAG TPA: hypothetical protein PKH06_03280, partial [Candidatus Dojkabacteria bacterium]|nr:hypothetical protein [Candidatus Dojkabacteria bacterium]
MEKENNGSRIFAVLVIIVVAFCFGVIFGRNIAPSADSILSLGSSKKSVNFDLFWQVWDILDSEYVEKDKVSQEDRVYGAIKGLVDSYD